MRLTTKIMTGILLSLLLIPLIIIICLSFTDRKNYNRPHAGVVEVSQANQTALPLAPFKTLIIDEAPFNSPDEPHRHYWMGGNCRARFTPSVDKNGANTLYIPEALKDFIELNTSNDTLRVRLNAAGIAVKYKEENHTSVSIHGIDLRFEIESFDIINNMQNFGLAFENLETDFIKVRSPGDIRIDSCIAQVIEPLVRTQHKKLTMANCKAQKLFLDIDETKNWNIENSDIKEEYITGSKKHSLIQHRRESGTIIWQPKNKDAQLNVTIQGDTTRIHIR